MAQALVVDTAAAQSIRQEIGSRHLAAPEWPLKDDCHAQVMRRMIVAGEMLLHGEAQRQILEFDLAEPIMWQSENDSRTPQCDRGSEGAGDSARPAPARSREGGFR